MGKAGKQYTLICWCAVCGSLISDLSYCLKTFASYCFNIFPAFCTNILSIRMAEVRMRLVVT
jgi:hypothetical protein